MLKSSNSYSGILIRATLKDSGSIPRTEQFQVHQMSYLLALQRLPIQRVCLSTILIKIYQPL